MTITVYTGHVGSGKSYECVKSVILPALKAGRPVVSNIDGLDVDKIRDFLAEQGCDEPGELLVVDREDIKRPDFFPARQSDGSYQRSAWVPLGALVVVDECPQYWGTDRQLHPAHLLFFREHRHICAADGTACDLVLISQTVDAIHRSLRGLAQFQMDFRKLAALGLSSKYSMVTYEGARTRQFKKHVLGRANGSYDKRIFPLYQSFASKHGKILQTDKRLTIWSNKLFWVVVVIAPVLFCGSLWMLYHQFFAPKSVAAPVSIDGVPLPAGAVPPLPVTRSLAQRAMAPVAPPVAPSAPPVSPWRVAGSARFSGAAWAVLRRPGYPLRYVPLGICQLSFGLPTSCRAGDELFEPEDGSSGSSGGSVAGAWGPDAAAARSVKR